MTALSYYRYARVEHMQIASNPSFSFRFAIFFKQLDDQLARNRPVHSRYGSSWLVKSLVNVSNSISP
jgi:hypothetical protein